MNEGRMRSESGVALVAALLIMLLMSTLLAGFTVVVMSDQQNRWVDRERTKAFYASHAAIEKLTADLGGLFATNVAPSPAQLNALQAQPPTTMSDVSFVAADGTSGYALGFTPDANGNPTAQSRMIASGPYEGMTGLVTPYTIDVTARTAAGGETHLRRQLQAVAIPVFQFGIFSETDLSFFPGPVFNFGGRVHTNANLYLASGATLTLADRVTAVNEIIRTNLSNGWATNTNYTGAVNVVTVPGSTRPLAPTEGSLVGTIGSALNDPTWMNLTMGPYAGSLRNGRTGARRLDLALVTIGGQPVDLVRRPTSATENVTNPQLYGQRYFSFASLRILLSDTPAKIQNLPTVTAANPVLLEGNWVAAPPAGYNNNAVDAVHPPIGLSSGNLLDGYRTLAGTPVIGGNIKIEAQDPNGNWRDVTAEILSLGIAGPNISNPNGAGNPCAPPSPDAVIRIQRVRDVPSTVPPLGLGATAAQNCGVGTTNATDFWPNVLYDPREGNVRDVAPGNAAQVALGGVMHYIELDVNNLRRWFLGQIGATGVNVMNTTGYVVYFSDRRGNQDLAGNETGEYGFEDTVNPASAAGTPNNVLDAGEDVNANGVLDTYGGQPRANGAAAPLGAGATPGTFVDPAIAKVNQAIFFRRALKLTNGTLGNIIAPGLTIVSENPVYVQGDYNANAAGGFGNPHVATAIIADAVTLLSNAWSDTESFLSPNDLNGRQAIDTWYRVAVMAGKTPSFPQPTGWGAAQDFGTDGGVHNFLRYIENWGTSTLNYRGSLASFYYSRQATGTYKCCTQVYSPPTRGYNFDIDFLTPALLPPRTPAFRDLNTLGFTQITTAGR
jgi:hypothetical protein